MKATRQGAKQFFSISHTILPKTLPLLYCKTVRGVGDQKERPSYF